MIEPKPLPYAYDALEPTLGRDQLRLHYERHYLRYIRRINGLTDGLLDSVGHAVLEARRRQDAELARQANQAWAHERYFASMSPPHRSAHRRPGTDLEHKWVQAATSVFGSGWVWLVGPRRPRVVATHDDGIPDAPVLLVMDVWEHAYYCDYPGERAEYARRWFRELADWSLTPINR